MGREAWEVSTVTMLSALKKEPVVQGIALSDLRYTVLDTQRVAYRDAQELAEIHSLDKKVLPKEYVAFRPERLALHETIVAVSTQLQLTDERQMQSVSRKVYESVRRELSELNLEQLRSEITADTTRLVDAYLQGEDISQQRNGKQVADLCEKAKEATFGEFKAEYKLKDAVIARVTDLQFTEQATQRIQPLVQKHLPQDIARLEIPEPGKRLTLMVAGGQASGKGSSVARLQSAADEEGIRWANVVKINTDSYKPLLLSPEEVRPQLYSQLSQEEASLVNGKIQQRLNQMAEAKQAPHTFVDQVFVGADRIQYGLKEGGRVYGYVVSTDVHDAIQRAYARGEEEGRFEDTKGILRLHRGMTTQMPTTLAQFAGRDVNFRLVDNNVTRGEAPRPVMDVDLLHRAVTVHSQAMLDRFVAKTRINLDATSAENLYETSATANNDYLAPFLQAECEINRSEAGEETVQDDQLHDKFKIG